MALASAPGLGCAVLGQIFGVKPKPKAEEVAVAPVAEPVREVQVDDPPPQPPRPDPLHLALRSPRA